jgi:two-component SAPR family response regulator
VLVAGNNTLLDFKQSEIWGDSPADTWIKVELAVDPKKNTLKLTVNGAAKSANIDVRDLDRYNFYFGSNSNIHFATTDVAPIVVKDIRIYDGRKRLIRRWKLARHGENHVYDECISSKAVVTNPVWEINSHAKWKKLASIAIPDKNPQITFDRERKRVFIVKNRFLYIYSAERDTVSILVSEEGVPVNTKINQLIYDETGRRLIMYDFMKNHLSCFSFESQSWDNETDTLTPSFFMHHNNYFDEQTQTLYTFGGYGYHLYSALLQSFSATKGKWEHRDLSGVIPPRYLAAMGILNDSLLLCFGGYGNTSGKQSEAPHNFYDLYTINPHTANVRKIWELNGTDGHFTNSNSLVVDKRNRTFLTLSYPNNAFKTQIYLHEYSLKTPEFRRLADSIPFLFYDVESYCNLFMPSDSSALFAVASYMDGEQCRTDIYSISYPPLGIADILQTGHEKNAFPGIIFYFLLSLTAMALTFPVAKRIWKTKRIRSILKTVEADNTPAKSDEADGQPYPAINVLNEFEILDSCGVNISHLLTPTMSQLFLLLYFRTADGGKGITSGELQKILWPDKDFDSARNNRNVYFNKLRAVLNPMESITLSKNNDCWLLSFDGDRFHNDYEQVMNNIRILKKKKEPDKALLNATIRMAKKGKLLPSYEIEWLDEYKESYANTVIEFLSGLLTHPGIKNDPALLLNISEAILTQDSTDETGIKLKCNILYKLGKKKQALQYYNKYAEEYFNLLNAKPELKFEEIPGLSPDNCL